MSELTFAQKQQSRAGSHPVMQRKAIHNSGFVSNVPPIVHEVLQSPGQSLDVQSRTYFEPKFGIDFSKVRVHTNSKASEISESG